ncbi:MAG: hypothetical protein M1837_006363 [Sclerophora amabilis]|nr:MAG: hypothetical protein M1837_006363 [Sclerophora amabilis]
MATEEAAPIESALPREDEQTEAAPDESGGVSVSDGASGAGAGAEEGPHNSKLSRKRTKTGCLNPLNNFRPGGPSSVAETGSSTTSFRHTTISNPPSKPQLDRASSSSSSYNPLPAIAPRPTNQSGHAPTDGDTKTSGQDENMYTFYNETVPETARRPSNHLPPRIRQLYQDQSGNPAAPEEHVIQYYHPVSHHNIGPFNPAEERPVSQSRQPSNQTQGQPQDEGQVPLSQSQRHGQRPSLDLGKSASTHSSETSVRGPGEVQATSQRRHSEYSGNPPPGVQRSQWTSETDPRIHNLDELPRGNAPPYIYGSMINQHPRQPVQANGSQYTHAGGDSVMRDDDPYDVTSDDDMDIDGSLGGDDANPKNSAFGSRSDLRLVEALETSQDDRAVRSFRSFINEPNMMATYRPSPMDSPLLDPKTARIFCHFITVTGPSLSMYERHPTNPSVMFQQGPVPLSQQSLWTYTLPTLALQSSPLLHAMLALASLHIAKLQGGTTIPSLKHYHRALRRVARCVSLPSKRAQIATLAATLLLGFWEVMAAEHSKWNSHLSGARQLLVEFNFAGLTSRIKSRNAQKDVERRQRLHSGIHDSILQKHFKNYKHIEDIYVGVDREVDEELVSLLMGRKLRYGDHGHVLDDARDGTGSGGRDEPLTQKDLEDYEVRCDLFWWFVKQDLYQSILSGDGLLLEYDRWSHCPPRAAIGKLGAPHGTYDHLILLTGRIADYAARDQRRKRKIVEANGGVWRPPAGSDIKMPQRPPPPPQPGPHPPNSQNRQNNQAPSPGLPPGMYGMIPPHQPTRMPQAFSEKREPSPTSNANDDMELEAATIEAEEEWNEIKAALQVFKECLGPHYQPLPPEYMQPLSTPFGPAVFYKMYSISCIWSLYYMALIILHRAHPSMPPAAMMAAGIAAPKTAGYANEIGRIAAGLVPTSTTSEVNPSLGAALIEATMSLFFAGVQYQDAAQRGWTVTKLRDIARLTGWESSAAVAAGCETSWEKQAALGRGPPYTRVGDPISKDDRMAGRKPFLTDEEPKDTSDRRFIGVNPAARIHWAIGILGLEEDLGKLKLEKKEAEAEAKAKDSCEGRQRSS